MNVKIATSKVIAALEKRLAKIEADHNEHEKAQAERVAIEKAHQKAVADWKTRVADIALQRATPETANVYDSYRGRRQVVVEIALDDDELPPPPKRAEMPVYIPVYPAEARVQVESALRVLRMTDEPFVSASVMKQIARYL